MEFIQNYSGHLRPQWAQIVCQVWPLLNILFTMSHMAKMPKFVKWHNSVNYSQDFMKVSQVMDELGSWTLFLSFKLTEFAESIKNYHFLALLCKCIGGAIEVTIKILINARAVIRIINLSLCGGWALNRGYIGDGIKHTKKFSFWSI